MVTIRNERPADVIAREALLDTAYGPARFTKTSERLREGRRPVEQLSFVASERGRMVGTVRLWHVRAGAGRAALLLGPLAVHPDCRNRGIGSKLMRHAIAAARRLGHGAVLLVGDAPTTAGLALRPRRPQRCGCRAATSASACLRSSSSPVRSRARAV